MAVSCYAKDRDTDQKTEAVEMQNYTHEKMTVDEFISWSREGDNGLNKTKDISDIKYKLSYLPAPVMAFLELRSEEYNDVKFKTTSENYSAMTYFNFRMEAIDGTGELLKHNLQSPAQYEERVKYISFEMQNDLFLVQGKDTLFPGLYHFERVFEIAPYATVMFAFDNELFNSKEEFTIVYYDRLFDKGYVKFNYKNKQLINLPNIVGS